MKFENESNYWIKCFSQGNAHMSSAASVLSSQQGAVVTLTLNRPDRLNALDSDMATDLCGAIEAVKNNASARVVVLRGEGKSFCAGGDVVAMHAHRDDLPAAALVRVLEASVLQTAHNGLVARHR